MQILLTEAEATHVIDALKARANTLDSEALRWIGMDEWKSEAVQLRILARKIDRQMEEIFGARR